MLRKYKKISNNLVRTSQFGFTLAPMAIDNLRVFYSSTSFDIFGLNHHRWTLVFWKLFRFKCLIKRSKHLSCRVVYYVFKRKSYSKRKSLREKNCSYWFLKISFNGFCKRSVFSEVTPQPGQLPGVNVLYRATSCC